MNRLDWRAYIDSANPIAAALMARMHMAPSERWRVKAACLRLLAGLPLNGLQRRLIAQFVDQYLVLDVVQEAAFQAEVATFRPPEREVVMEIVTSWERRARAEGLAEGLAEGVAEGQRRIVERMVRRRFGTSTPAISEQIAALAPTQLEALAEALLEFTSLMDVQHWLAVMLENP